MSTSGPVIDQNYIERFIATCTSENLSNDTLDGITHLTLQQVEWILATADHLFLQDRPIELATVVAKRAALLNQEIALSNSKLKSDQDYLVLIRNQLQQHQIDSEHLYYTVYLRSNCYEQILTQCLPLISDASSERVADFRKRVTQKLFEHLALPTVILNENFYNRRIYNKSYYEVYQLLAKKMALLETIIESYQDEKLQQLTEALNAKIKNRATVQKLTLEIFVVLGCFGSAMNYLTSTIQEDKALQAKSKFESLMSRFKPLFPKIEKIFKNCKNDIEIQFINDVRHRLQMYSSLILMQFDKSTSILGAVVDIYSMLNDSANRRQASPTELEDFLQRCKTCEEVSTSNTLFNVFGISNDELKLLADYAAYQSVSLSLSAHEKIYRLTLKAVLAQTKNKDILPYGMGLCAAELFFKIKEIVSENYRVCKATQEAAPATKLTSNSAAIPAENANAIREVAKLFLVSCNDLETSIREQKVSAFFRTLHQTLSGQAGIFVEQVLKNLEENTLNKKNAPSIHEVVEEIKVDLHRVNAVYELFKFVKGRITQPDIQKLRQYFIGELAYTLNGIFKYLNNNCVRKDFLLLPICMISEKLDWLDDEFTAWQEGMFAFYKDAQENRKVTENIRFLLRFFEHAVVFRSRYDNTKKADKFHNQVTFFFQETLRHIKQNPSLINEIKSILDYISESKRILTTTQKQPSHAVLTVIIDYYLHADRFKQSSDRKTIRAIGVKASELQKKIAAMPLNKQSAEITTWVKDFLVSYETFADNTEVTSLEDLHSLRNLAKQLNIYFSSPLKLVFEKETPSEAKDAIQSDCNVAYHTIQFTFDTFIEALNELIKSKDNAKDDLASTTASLAALDLNQPVAETSNQEPQEQNLDNELKDQQAKQDAELARLQQKNAKKEQKQAQHLLRELEAKKAKLKREFDEKRARATEEHRNNLKSMKEKHQKSMDAALFEHEKALTLMRLNQKKQQEQLSKEQSDELGEFKATNKNALLEARKAFANQSAVETLQRTVVQNSAPVTAPAVVAIVAPAVQSDIPNLETRIQQDPAVILDLLYSAVEYDTGIAPSDFELLHRYKERIAAIPFAVYQNKVSALFNTHKAIKHFNGLHYAGLLSAVFPGLNLWHGSLDQFPALQLFVYEHLAVSKTFPQTLGLFVLMSLIYNPSREKPLKTCCNDTLQRFWGAMHGVAPQIQQVITLEVYEAVLGNKQHDGLYAEYVRFESAYFVQCSGYKPAIVPGFRGHQQAKAMLSTEKVITSSSFSKGSYIPSF